MCVLSEYRTLLVKMYYEQFVKLAIPVAKVNYELMVDTMFVDMLQCYLLWRL